MDGTHSSSNSINVDVGIPPLPASSAVLDVVRGVDVNNDNVMASVEVGDELGKIDHSTLGEALPTKGFEVIVRYPASP
jgi:hypothetical protein